MSFLGGVVLGGEIKPSCPKCKTNTKIELIDVCLIAIVNNGAKEWTTAPVWRCDCRWVFMGRTQALIEVIKKHGSHLDVDEGKLIAIGSKVLAEEKTKPMIRHEGRGSSNRLYGDGEANSELKYEINNFKLE